MRSYRFENCGRVVVDGVNAGSILPEEEHASQHQTVHNIPASGESLEGLPETNADGRLLVFKGLVNSVDLLGDVNVVGIQLADPAKVLHRLAATVLEEQPTGRFFDPQSSNEK
jgi:hypothetical protein